MCPRKPVEVSVVDFHRMRRRCGAQWIECAVPLAHVSILLGHAEVTTVALHYTVLADELLAAAIERVDAASLPPAAAGAMCSRQPVGVYEFASASHASLTASPSAVTMNRSPDGTRRFKSPSIRNALGNFVGPASGLQGSARNRT
jgi:hypothetical protein